MGTDGRITHLGQQAGWVWRELQVPVIAAITGACLGGGLQIALGADIRIVAPDAKLSVLEIRWGLIPDMTGTWVLPRLVGRRRGQGADLHRPHGLGRGGGAHRAGHAGRRRPARRGHGAGRARSPASRPIAIRHAKRLLERSVEPGRTVAEQFLDERTTMGVAHRHRRPTSRRSRPTSRSATPSSRTRS